MKPLLTVLFLVGCQSVSDARKEVAALEAEADHQRAENFKLSTQADQINQATIDMLARVKSLSEDETVLRAQKAEKGVHYILHVSIRQVSYSLSLSKQLRDAVNEEEFDLPTDKTTYEHANPGDDLFDSFRAGSAIFRGSLGSWRLKVVGKRVQIDG